ncbi:MAG TPA: DUF4328 domain-containing protein [Micromonosporaceae bacterium]|nr:DUF4328 domain-containing protein [Micromonosporaceae bacterium]
MAPNTRTYAVRALGVATSIALAVCLAAYLVSALSPVFGREMARRALANEDPDLVNGAALLELALTVPFLITLLASIVLVIIWLYRARKNLEAFPGAEQTLRAGWAIGGWFVPFANLVIPYRVMANVARASLHRPSTPVLAGVWWGFWLAANIADRFVAGNDLDAYGKLPSELGGPADYQRYVDYYNDAIGPRLVPFALYVIAGICLVLLILRISRAQTDRIARGTPPPLLPGTQLPYPQPQPGLPYPQPQPGLPYPQPQLGWPPAAAPGDPRPGG